MRTLFVSGLPLDCKPRELYLLFRAYSGYENSLLKVTNKNGKVSPPVGFVTFSTRQDADDACRKLQGVRFDPDGTHMIRLELARSNTKVPKPKQPSPPMILPSAGLLPNQNAASNFLNQSLTGPGSELQGLVDQLSYITDQPFLGLPLNYSPALHLLPGSGATNAQHLLNHHTIAAAVAQMQQQHPLNLIAAAAAAQQNNSLPTSMNPPCSTLFVANLGAHVTDEEVRQAFKQYPGFSRVRMHHKGNSTVAFVEYSTLHNAALALQSLQGFQLNNGNSIRIEYAKAKMGENNNNINASIKTDI